MPRRQARHVDGDRCIQTYTRRSLTSNSAWRHTNDCRYPRTKDRKEAIVPTEECSLESASRCGRREHRAAKRVNVDPRCLVSERESRTDWSLSRNCESGG